jgi:hypothetical protein
MTAATCWASMLARTTRMGSQVDGACGSARELDHRIEAVVVLEAHNHALGHRVDQLQHVRQRLLMGCDQAHPPPSGRSVPGVLAPAVAQAEMNSPVSISVACARCRGGWRSGLLPMTNRCSRSGWGQSWTWKTARSTARNHCGAGLNSMGDVRISNS